MTNHRQTSTEELNRFKSEIPLADYLASRWGFVFDRKESSRGSLVMRHPDGRKIIVARGMDGHYIFFNPHDPADNGSIIDFCLNHLGDGSTLGHVRKELRAWLGASYPPPLPPGRAPSRLPDVEPVEHSLLVVRARFAAYERVSPRHHYLTEVRRIPPALLLAPRFRDHVHADERGNVIFGHRNQDGLCGYEIKGDGFTGFAAGGTKGLWDSGKDEGDRKLVVAETAIDALSYAAIHGFEDSRFASFGGQMNPNQNALLRGAIAEMPDGSEIIAAVDNDAGGDSMARDIEASYTAVERPGIAFRRHSPSITGQDWNDALRASVHEEPHPRKD